MSNIPITKIAGTITRVRDLTPTARDVTVTLDASMTSIAGSFVNLFIKNGTRTLRRAFSISSASPDEREITLTIRLCPEGAVSPLFWQPDVLGTRVELMGPLGLNTTDKLHRPNIFLFAFGIGAGVVKALAETLIGRSDLAALTIMTGSRNAEDIVHKDFFDALAGRDARVQVAYVVSTPRAANSLYPHGYIQHHLTGLHFDDADVYVCGQEEACQQLVEAIQHTAPHNCDYFIEGFH